VHVVVFPRDWMGALASHYDAIRGAYPTDEVVVVFDIDGTILDLRHLVVHVLLAYDRDRGTDLFHGLVADDIAVPETRIDLMLGDLDVARERRDDVADFYREHLWDEAGQLAAGAPYRGVLGVIRWFQLQPGVRIGLNTGRPGSMRRITLDSLNAVGHAARVRFEPDLLFMRDDTTASVPEAKVTALRAIRSRGLRVLAVVDNEPENLDAMIAAEDGDEVLFLHADTIFGSQRREGLRVVEGTAYELGGLISEEGMGEHVELVWHGVNDQANLAAFLRSGIRWAEMDVRCDPVGRLILRHDGFDERPWSPNERSTPARPTVGSIVRAGRSIKLDVKEDADALAAALALVADLGLDGDRVWFNARIDVVGAAGFARFRRRFPGATASCPIDFLIPLLAAAPEEADRVLDRLRSWGVTRLSVRWAPGLRAVIDRLEGRGWETNVYAVPDLQSFLEAALLLPTSVTADFNFPAWRRFGRGSGEHGVFHRYEDETVDA